MISIADKSQIEHNSPSVPGCLIGLIISSAMWAVIIWVVLITLSGCITHDPWTKRDTMLQGAVTGLTLVDWLQTRAIAKQPEKYKEIGPASWCIGRHPSTGQVDFYFGCSVVSKALITHLLPRKYRLSWQSLCMGSSMAFIINNENIGISIGKAF